MKIGNHDWKIIIADRKELDGYDGRTIPNELKILIAEDLPRETKVITFIHEVVHAILDTQGRCYQKRFELEDMCEFIAWQYFEIESAVNDFLKEVA